MVLIALAACSGPATPTQPDTATPGDTDLDDTASPPDCALPGSGSWSVVAEDLGAGVLLSGWLAPGTRTVTLVGGDLAGGPGVLARYDGSTVCTEAGVTERALWWVHGRAADDWYAVGEAGTVLHVVDGVRTREDLPTDANLYGVHDDGVNVWAVGGDPFTPDSGEVWKREAGSWTLVQGGLPGVAFKVWDGTIVGDQVGFRIQDGGLVPFEQPDRLLTVRSRTPDDVWAVGGLGSPIVRHFDGTTWESVDTAVLSGPLNGVWTAPGEDVWVAGFSGVVARWDGASWEPPPTPLSYDTFHAAAGACGEVLFIGGNFLASSDFHGTILRWGPSTEPAAISTCE